MKEEKQILNTLGQVDEQYIAEAAPGKRANKKPGWIKWTSIAACFALVAVLGIGASRGGWFGSNSDIATLDNGETINFVKSDAVGGSLSLDMDVTTRELTDEETRTLFGDLPVIANALFTTAGNRLVGFEGRIGDIKLIVSTSDVSLLDTVIDGSEKVTEVDNVSVTAGYFLTDPNSKGDQTAIYYATFELGSSTVYVENAGAKSEREIVKNDLAAVIQKLIANGQLDTAQFHSAK